MIKPLTTRIKPDGMKVSTFDTEELKALVEKDPDGLTLILNDQGDLVCRLNHRLIYEYMCSDGL